MGGTALVARVESALADPSTQPKPAPRVERQVSRQISLDTAATLDSLPLKHLTNEQPSLFGAEFQPKIIPFEALNSRAGATTGPRSLNWGRLDL